MDAADRTQLDALRRRAYGPDSDIHDDPAALARLIELEDLSRTTAVGAVPESHRHGGETVAIDALGAGGAMAQTAPVPADRVLHEAIPAIDAELDTRRSSALRGVLMATAAAAVAVVLAVVLTQPQSEPAPAAVTTPTSAAASDTAPTPDPFVHGRAPGALTLMTIPLDGAVPDHTGWPIDPSSPAFPSLTTLNWATPVGKYFGWQLWVAGGGDYPHTEHCILLKHGSNLRASCLTQGGQDAGMLHVELATPDVSPDERPPQMNSVDDIRFLWIDDDVIDVMLGSFGSD